MKRNQRKGDKMRVLLFCVLAALVAAPAYAQYPQGAKNRLNDGNARLVVTDAADTTNKLVRPGSVTGSLLMDDAARDRDQVWSHLGALVTNLYANGSSNVSGGYMDSTAALATAEWSKFGIYFYPQIQDTLGTFVAFVAVQVRGHYSQSVDSLSTFATFPQFTPPDTLGESNGSELTGIAVKALPTEFLIAFHIQTSNPRGRLVTFEEIGLDRFWAPYTSIRVRFVKAETTDLTDVVGRMSLRLDLVGGR